MTIDDKTFFLNSLNQINIKLDYDILEKILLYYEYLLIKNKSVNLISRQNNFQDGIITHLVDSLSPLQVDFPNDLKLLDLGSGGGLPGIPLKIANPGWCVTLIESKAKKCVFLNEMAEKFGEGRIKVLNKFVDKNCVSLSDEIGLFDVITVRAVAKLSSLIITVSHLIKSSGYLVAYKGPNYLEEFIEVEKYLKKYRMKFDKKIEYILPINNAKRILLFFQKY
ncbi:MAG: 16S rRNA (guanine(527)-N(7))-methyltransferase RsmG [Deltaproteobacteria bacterium]|jgi:16S rRNA (guanine527-N7)-methyltransferase|nr:16S rRNA (guanine(527)-N(7))-methyltransferase RsmG [Deltaproteobacteria bacterium]